MRLLFGIVRANTLGVVRRSAMKQVARLHYIVLAVGSAILATGSVTPALAQADPGEHRARGGSAHQRYRRAGICSAWRLRRVVVRSRTLPLMTGDDVTTGG